MQQDNGNNLPETNLLAHGVTIEAARQGEPGSCFAGLAAAMLKLAAHSERPGGGVRGDAAGARRLSGIEHRIATLLEHQQRLARLAAAIRATARQQTRALAMAEAHAQAQVWRPEQAAELRSQVTVIETRHQRLHAAIESDRERASSLLKACRPESDSGGGGANLDRGR